MIRKNKQRKTKPKKEKRHILTLTWVITFFALICTFLSGLYYHYQLQNYENGVLEVYAVQQDNYVQLVLDQINLVKDRKDAEIIKSILGTMDGSSNKYWTLSKNDALIFVRDVTETNKYHGYTENTYYISDSAQIFINNLTVNRVVHQMVYIGARKYIASGVKFQYNDSSYQICLLTNPDTILDHNAYLSARINLSIMMGLVLAIFLIMSLTLGLWMEKLNKSQFRIENENIMLRRTIEKLNISLSRQEMYDTRTAVFHSNMLALFIGKLREKKVLPIVLTRFTFDTAEARAVFLAGSQMVLGKNYLRFWTQDNALLVIGLQCTREDVVKAVRVLEDENCHAQDCTEIKENLDEALTAYMEKWNIEEE